VGFHNPNAPLATMEMLLSPSQTYTRPDGSDVLVEVATRDNIETGFELWLKRAAAHADNVAVFYFCGHGVMGANDYLLPSDFGAVNRENPWADAIDITETARAMRRLASGPLYFFIDACRQAARDALSPGASPPALANVDFAKPVRGFTRLILWATGEGEAAFGAADKASRFCAALTEALSGYEAEPTPEGTGWVVTGDLLQRSVSTILEAGNGALEPAKRQYVERQLIGSQRFHFETALPHRVVAGIPSSWSVGPEVRQMLAAWGVSDALPDKVLEVLTEHLEARNLQVEALQKEAKDWTRRYDELKRDLEAEPDSALAQRARALLEAGKLHEAGAAFEELIRAAEARHEAAGAAFEELIRVAEARREAESERIASYSLNRGRIFRLEFKPLEALPFYEKAFALRPSDPQYALAYAGLLLDQHDYRRAEPVYVAALGRLRELAQANPAAYRPEVATTLHNLGALNAAEHRYAEALAAYGEALPIYEEFAARSPAQFGAVVEGLRDLIGQLPE
jgi:tetratricopeptide (TPR) repeat protein